MNKTKKIIKKNKNRTIKKCFDNLVKPRMENYNKLKKEMYDEREKEYNKILKKKDLLKEVRDDAIKSLKRIKKERKSKKGSKIQEKTDMNIFCNPGCKGTILEPGNKLPSEIYKKYKDVKGMIEILKEDRKNLFGNKTDVLIDNFYEKAPKNFVDKIKKKSGISLCGPIDKFYW
uniref:Uncharacterized protein n=1 Tax=viral metagenome TaxID=1070528 RepID=A0A6C0DCI3_9ZZZZ